MFNFFGDKSKFTKLPNWISGILHYIGNDWHIGSKYNDNPWLEALVKIWLGREVSLAERIHAIHLFGSDIAQKMTYELIVKLRIYLNGDIIDLKCCPLDKLDYYMQMHDDLVALFNPPGKDPHFNEGNHDSKKWVEKSWDERYIIITSPTGRTMAMEHGHRLLDELKGKPKWQKYCDKPCGASKFDLLKVDILDDMDWLKANRPLPKGFTDFADNRAHELKVDIISFGHFHVEGQRWYPKAFSYVHINPAHQLNMVWF